MLVPTQRCRFLHLHRTKHSPVNIHWVSESWRDATGDPHLENQSSLVTDKLHGSIESRYMWLTAVRSFWTLCYSPGEQPPWGSLVAGLEYPQAKNSWENWANVEKKSQRQGPQRVVFKQSPTSWPTSHSRLPPFVSVFSKMNSHIWGFLLGFQPNK